MRKTILRRILIIPALLIAALLPEQALACITVSLGWWEDGDKVKATAFIEDYYDQGDCYYSAGSTRFTHNYAASVQIQSPQGRWASDSDSMNNVRNGGGYADAFTSISTRNDFGIYNVTVSASIVCSTGMNAAYQDAGQLEVEDPCTDPQGNPVTPVSRWGPPDPYNNDVADINGLTYETYNSWECLKRNANAAGGRITAESAFRPAAYQRHLREAWEKYQIVKHWPADQCTDIQNNIENEFHDVHSLVDQPGKKPAASSKHTQGKAVDINTPQGLTWSQADTMAKGCGFLTISNDRGHYYTR